MAVAIKTSLLKTPKMETKRRNSIRMGVSGLKVNQDPTSAEWAEEWATLKNLYVLQPRETTAIVTTTKDVPEPREITPTKIEILDIEGQVYTKAEKTTMKKLLVKLMAYIRELYQKKHRSKGGN